MYIRGRMGARTIVGVLTLSLPVAAPAAAAPALSVDRPCYSPATVQKLVEHVYV